MSNYTRIREYRDDPEYTDYQDHDDSPVIVDLTEQIRGNIFQINSGASDLERAMKGIGTDKDSPQLRDKIHETSQNVNKIVQTTTRLLHKAAEKKANKQQKVQLDLLKSQFQDSLQRFHILQKKAADRVKTTVKLSVRSMQQQPLVSFVSDIELNEDFEDDQRQAQVFKDQEIIEDDLALILEREQRIRQLESDILDVNEIFRDLGAMVQSQGEVLDTIDSNVERAATNVEAGNEQLVSAAKYQSKSRKKMCCLVVIFLVIAIIITVIIVVALKT
ncbi:unnamed protein product [Candidula unifasciata]|uniref:t-SNARE coiled-coil homology domain-containing protein n=1 Tax=Candidula unifasciata TaxID=100452 RepID=A0A8S3ZZD8_9EUPU|nr:unnamed protein product [Candidula unifasciata]